MRAKVTKPSTVPRAMARVFLLEDFEAAGVDVDDARDAESDVLEESRLVLLVNVERGVLVASGAVAVGGLELETILELAGVSVVLEEKVSAENVDATEADVSSPASVAVIAPVFVAVGPRTDVRTPMPSLSNELTSIWRFCHAGQTTLT